MPPRRPQPCLLRSGSPKSSSPHDVDKGEVRDHKELFVAALCLSDVEGHRDVGLALLRRLPPYQVDRVVDFLHDGDREALPNLPALPEPPSETDLLPEILAYPLPRRRPG